MQDASINFGVAVTGAGRMWVRSRLRTDWAGDGYDGDGSIDDLGKQAGGWSVSHHLDDGLPDEVSFVAGLGTAELKADLTGGASTADRPLSARAYWSPLRTDSPIQGFDRDVAPITHDVGLVTASGPEYVRVFTGQMIDVPTQGGRTTLSALSANRLKLSALVHPPAVAGRYEGARADWVVSYAAAASGVYLSPPPPPGCRWWAPMHGSIHPFIPSTNQESIGVIFYAAGTATGGDNQKWRTGPYSIAPDLFFGPTLGANGFRGSSFIDINNTRRVPYADGDDFISQAGLRGRLEMWMYGAEQSVNDFPASSGDLGGVWMAYTQGNTNGTQINMYVVATADPATDRHPTMNVFDGTTSYTFRHSDPIPADGQWHRIGWAYDLTGNPRKRWIYIDDDIETDNSFVPTTAFPAVDDYMTNSPRFRTRFPVAEVQLTSGDAASPDDYPWVHTGDSHDTFTPDMVMTPSTINLANIAETQPREAWELIGSHAQAELAMLRTDELDLVTYLGPAWWVRDEQQVVRDIVTTSTNSALVDVVQDPTKIRNSVRVTFGEALSTTRWQIVATLATEREFPPGITTFVLPLTTAAVEIRGFTIPCIDDSGSQPTATHYATFNTNSEGTGSFALSSQVPITILEWHPGAVTIEIDNQTGANLYLANDVGWPALAIAAKPHFVTSTFALEEDPTSIAARGQRSLPITAPAIQRMTDARRLARNLKTVLRNPVAVLGSPGGGIEVAGDPRRQPGDLTRVRDEEAGVDDSLWRVQTVEHAGGGARYRNSITYRRTFPIMIIGEGVIGETILGPSSSEEIP